MDRPPSQPHLTSWRPLVDRAVAEDLGPGDITSTLAISQSAEGTARIEAREPLLICGLQVAREVFRQIDPLLSFTPHFEDGTAGAAGERLVTLSGSLRSILAGERVALNFLARLCGVATSTRHFVDTVRGTRAAIVDTRKTLPGWRILDKYAVAVGGGVNHRIGLYDGILLKDNHLAAAGSVEAALKTTRERAPANLRIQVEVQSETEALAACTAGADFLLIDNRTPEELQRIAQAIAAAGHDIVLEASGGITLDNVRAYAETGVQRISIGALTHSAPNADLALELDPLETTR